MNKIKSIALNYPNLNICGFSDGYTSYDKVLIDIKKSKPNKSKLTKIITTVNKISLLVIGNLHKSYLLYIIFGY